MVAREYWSEFNLKTKQSSARNKMIAKQRFFQTRSGFARVKFIALDWFIVT